MATGECGYHDEDCGDLDSLISSTTPGAITISTSQKRAVELSNILYSDNKSNGSTLYWGGLSPYEQAVLSKGGWNEGSYNDSLNPGVSNVDPMYDPAVWISVIVGLQAPTIKQILLEAPNLSEVLAKAYTFNPESTNVSLGNYAPNGYTTVGENYDMTYFQAQNWQYKLLNSIGLWTKVNQAFIEEQINEGKTFFVQQIGNKLGEGTEAEMEWIMSSGLYSKVNSVFSGFKYIMYSN